MINPWRVHRSRATITDIQRDGRCFTVTTPRGHKIEGWDLPAKFKLGEEVNIQSNFSICLDRYTVKTVNKIRNRGVAA